MEFEKKYLIYIFAVVAVLAAVVVTIGIYYDNLESDSSDLDSGVGDGGSKNSVVDNGNTGSSTGSNNNGNDNNYNDLSDTNDSSDFIDDLSNNETIVVNFTQNVSNVTIGGNSVILNYDTDLVLSISEDLSVESPVVDWRVDGKSIALLNLPFKYDYDDYSSNDVQVTLNGAEFASESLAFDGVDDYVTVSLDGVTSGKSEFAISFWINPASVESTDTIWEESALGTYWQNTIRMDRWFTRDESTGTTGTRDNSLDLPDLELNSWSNLVFVYSVSRGVKEIYKNGVLEASTSVSVDPLTSERDGGWISRPSDGTFFDGMISDFVVYDRSLSSKQIEKIFSAGVKSHSMFDFVSEELVKGGNWSVFVNDEFSGSQYVPSTYVPTDPVNPTDPVDECSTNSECPQGNSCQTGVCSSGSCTLIAKTSCVNNDGCCPSGCSNSNDNDCSDPSGGDEFPNNGDLPDIYMSFEGSPQNELTYFRPPNSNGCFSLDWTDEYERAICVADTRDFSDGDLRSDRSTLFFRAGSTSLRLFMRATPVNDWPSDGATHRNELHPQGDFAYPELGTERWYGYSVYFPEDSKFSPEHLERDLRFIISQWQNRGSPAVSFEIWGDDIYMVRNDGTSTSWRNIENLPVFTITPGEWIDIVTRIKWEKSDGIVEMWINGNKVYSDFGRPTVYSDMPKGGAFKYGIYYWKWKNSEDVTEAYRYGVHEKELFFDEVKVYEGSNGYSVVSFG